jgi:exopolyphosphatase/guanosine-5'-triphosphate,3'-diphosphate pyrophosphatase
MEGLSPGEARYVRKLATLLRVADALDRSHAQPISNLRAEMNGGKVMLRLFTQGPADLELWDVGHEAQLFHRVFAVKLAVSTAVSRHRRDASSRNRRRIVT